MQLIKFEKLRFLYTIAKTLSAADMLSLSFTQKELQPIQLKQRHVPPQIHFATLIHDDQIKLVHFMVRHETVLPSKKDDCHPV